MTNNKIFVDTGAWFAFIDKTDYLHPRAIKHFKHINAKNSRLYTSNLVIHETITLLARRLTKKIAIDFIKRIYPDESINIMPVDFNTEQEALKTFIKYADQDFTVVDCTSFVLMQENGIKRAFTFDKHFKTMKFAVEPV